MIREQLHWRKILCGCFRFLWLWLLISIMKTYAEQYHTSLKELEIYLLLLEKLSYKLCEKSFLQLNVLSRLKVFTGKNNYRLL